jgi:hypothetical protein
MARVTTAMSIVLLSGVAASAQTPSPRNPAPTFSLTAPPSPATLFPPREQKTPVFRSVGGPDTPPARPTRNVVCGMTIIEADPKVDPRIVRKIPANGADAKFVRIAPPTCSK